MKPSERFIGAISLVFNPQSKGEVSLQSSDPTKPPVFDPRFLTHAFDHRVMIEGIRQSMAILSAPVYAEKAIKWIRPENQSDEAIWVRLPDRLTFTTADHSNRTMSSHALTVRGI